MNRLWKRWQASTLLETHGYTASGRPMSRTDASGTHGWVYDALGRLKTNSTPAGTLKYTYDAAGNLLTLDSTTANGVSLSYQYDELNRLKKVTDNRLTGSKDTLYTFDGVGNLQTVAYPNGVTNLYRYDALNRLTNLVWAKTGTVKAGFGYTLGSAGNRLTLAETNNGSVCNYTWGYDNGFRLTSEQIATTAPTGTLSYGFDDVANRTSRSGSLGSLGAQSFNYDQRDQIDNDATPTTASTYFDANGNNTSYGGTFTYDWANRLLTQASPSVTLTYDADGNRIKKVAGGVTTWYLVATVTPSGYAQVVEELTGATPTTLSKVYGYGLDLIDQRVISPASTRFYGYDGLGSVKFLTDTTGAITDTYTYDAYGNLLASTGSTSNNYRYAGEQWDPDLGFYYLRARYLNPGIGRFQTADSFQGYPSDPISLHRYLYAADNPVNVTDPTGHENLLTQLVQMFGRALLAGSRVYAVHKVRNTVALGLLAATAFSVDQYYRLTTDPLSATQAAKVDRGLDVVGAAGNGRWSRHESRGRNVSFRVDPELGQSGFTPPAFHLIILWSETFELEDRLFASVLVHELSHSLQFLHIGNKSHERPAYQEQSDFLHAAGVVGTVDELDARPEFSGPGAHDFFIDQANLFRQYNVVNPAIWP
jgi:RHS repeat-associated protein